MNNKTHLFTSDIDIQYNSISSISSFFLYNIIRFYYEHQQEYEIDQEVERLIPDIPLFCRAIRELSMCTTMDLDVQEVIFLNVVRCLQFLDCGDNVCRDEILKLVRFLLSLSQSVQLRLILKQETVYALMQAVLNLLDTEALFL